jgi:GWxTD domain-containing protein
VGKPYYETYLTLVGNTVVFVKNADNKFQGKVNIQVSFSHNDSVIAANNYNLKSEELKDSSKRADFIDVQRYWLAKGIYTMKIIMKDVNDPNGKPVSVTQKINIGYRNNSTSISDVELLQSYASSDKISILNKSGYEMVPYIYNYYPQEINQLKFYAEIYNANKISGEHEKFIIRYFIESDDNHTPLREYNSVSVQQADTINPVLGGFNIESLPSGSYDLKLEAVDKNNVVRASREFPFIRHNIRAGVTVNNIGSVNIANTFVNKITNKDTLVDYIQSLYPISSLPERDFSNSKELKNMDMTLLKQYFYNFWHSRDTANPENDWNKYHLQVIAVNNTFRAPGMKGYQTDRGRVYLQYGAPNQRGIFDMNPATYPYEIWEYYKLNNGETDRKFVFYNPEIVTNNYVLLHSNTRGEIQNSQWQLILYSRTGQPANVQQNSMDDQLGEQTLDEYNNPR